jgi:hypothetical protein
VVLYREKRDVDCALLSENKTMRLIASPVLLSLVAMAATLHAQDLPPGAITARERAKWIGASVYGPRSLAAGVFVAGFETYTDWPSEWEHSWRGFGRRYAARDAAIMTANSVEAALGSAWGEDPRYFRCTCIGVRGRAANAAKLTFLARRNDGQLAPAWARYAGTTTGSVVQSAWLPPSLDEWQQVALREGTAFAGRFIGNLWTEFWPDLRRHLPGK